MRIYRPEKPAKLGRTYFGPVYPEAPPFNNPADDLAAIGLDITWVIGKDVKQWPEGKTTTVDS